MNSTEQTVNRGINDLSAMMRIIGNLYYRNPKSSVLEGLYEMIFNGKIQTIWPLKQDELLKRLEKLDKTKVIAAYTNLFEAQDAAICLDVVKLLDPDEQGNLVTRIETIVAESQMPILENANMTHYGFLWLLLAWLEAKRDELMDASENSSAANQENPSLQENIESYLAFVFFDLIQPLSKQILGKIETYSQSDFYKVLSMITREVIEEIDIELGGDSTTPPHE